MLGSISEMKLECDFPHKAKSIVEKYFIQPPQERNFSDTLQLFDFKTISLLTNNCAFRGNRRLTPLEGDYALLFPQVFHNFGGNIGWVSIRAEMSRSCN